MVGTQTYICGRMGWRNILHVLLLRCIICSASWGCSEVRAEEEELRMTPGDIWNGFDAERLKQEPYHVIICPKGFTRGIHHTWQEQRGLGLRHGSTRWWAWWQQFKRNPSFYNEAETEKMRHSRVCRHVHLSMFTFFKLRPQRKGVGYHEASMRCLR